MYSAFYFFGGVADVFLSVMLWFILDSKKLPIVYVDGHRIYSVGSVIKVNSSIIDEDCDTINEVV